MADSPRPSTAGPRRGRIASPRWARKGRRALTRLPELGRLIGVAWALVITAVAAISAGAWWFLGSPPLRAPAELTARDLNAITTRAFAVVAGLVGTALLVISYRKQRTAEFGEDRERTRLFNERFTAAYTELGSEHAAVRLGAVHALAHLADDAPTRELRQMCIDVLCAYLRMPHTPAPDEPSDGATEEQRCERQRRQLEFASLREVRHTIIRTIAARLREDAHVSWQGHDFDFTGVVFDGGDFSEARFSGGLVNFRDATFSGGTVSFRDVLVTMGTVNFSGAAFTGGTVDFRYAAFAGGTARFSAAQFAGGTVDFGDSALSGGTVDFTRSAFSRGTVNFGFARFLNGTMDFGEVTFTGGLVDFRYAAFAGDTVNFRGVVLAGGTVDFGTAKGPCPGGLLDAVAAGEPGTAVLPRGWEDAAGEAPGTE
ncbi:pentapeptide repeat protein [Haloactinospora alba]|uniref:Pentapeptide repeat protein n=1 Tax=Haloactinospora alba TaxID=405555 RepID=A0A543NMM5_9ACTN|nr:pentapeptide repeat-containing protein [Haloactinospora alba]TQN33081.1 pentapeptide repeat protein [Haloactinospora alba]